MDTVNVRWPRSLWAAVTPPGPDLPRLIGVAEADVVVIGGGFTGLSTALHLREAGVDVAIVEAMEPGWGASGLNNGQVIPTLSRPDPEDIIARHGAAGERFVGLLRDSASVLFDLAGRYQIQAEQEQTGWVQPVHSPGRLKIAERRVLQWSKFGASVELLSRDETRQMLGSEAWFGGFWNRTGGHINPLALSRGLARVVLDRGGRIYARSPALSVERRNDRWIVRTEKAEISGRVLIVATNAYTGEFSKSLMPAMAHEVMPVLSWQMATQPLSETARQTIIPGRQALSDTHGELYFARYDARNRLVTGGAVVGPGNKSERLKAIVAERLQRLWPRIGPIEFDYVWNGYVGMTTDSFPRIHRLGRNAYGWTGCNGRAVALSIALGDELSKAVRGVAEK
ncbi:MAG TPA: FAD-dependent oxidoreductase, partial [Bradyrhizobium sp.]|nr:FAD-dependent oxidoreductase [Bradyrhizobium sp.]